MMSIMPKQKLQFYYKGGSFRVKNDGTKPTRCTNMQQSNLQGFLQNHSRLLFEKLFICETNPFCCNYMEVIMLQGINIFLCDFIAESDRFIHITVITDT